MNNIYPMPNTNTNDQKKAILTFNSHNCVGDTDAKLKV